MLTTARLLSAAMLTTLLAACGGGGEPQVSSASATIAEESSTSTTETGTDKPQKVTTTTTPPKAPAKIVVTEAGLSSGPGYDDQPSATAGAVLVNEGGESAVFFEVVFTFKGAGGTAVGTETTYVYAVDPGGTAHAAVQGVSLQAPAVSVDATAIVDDNLAFVDGIVIPVTVTSVGQEQYTGLVVKGTANNPGTEVIRGGTVTCVLRMGGRIVGGVSTILDTLAPSAQVAWDTYSPMEGLDADAAECSGAAYE